MISLEKFAFGTLRLWMEGNLPQNLRQMWEEQRDNIDPLWSSVLSHIGAILLIVGLLLLGVLVMKSVTVYSGKTARYAIFTGFAVSLFGLGLWIAGSWTDGRGFAEQLKYAKTYLGLSWQDLGRKSREELEAHAEQNLREAGKRLRIAELQNPSFHEQTRKLRADFKSRYETFRALGMIQDVGYSHFVPQKPQ